MATGSGGYTFMHALDTEVPMAASNRAKNDLQRTKGKAKNLGEKVKEKF